MILKLVVLVVMVPPESRFLTSQVKVLSWKALDIPTILKIISWDQPICVVKARLEDDVHCIDTMVKLLKQDTLAEELILYNISFPDSAIATTK